MPKKQCTAQLGAAGAPPTSLIVPGGVSPGVTAPGVTPPGVTCPMLLVASLFMSEPSVVRRMALGGAPLLQCATAASMFSAGPGALAQEYARVQGAVK